MQEIASSNIKKKKHTIQQNHVKISPINGVNALQNKKLTRQTFKK